MPPGDSFAPSTLAQVTDEITFSLFDEVRIALDDNNGEISCK
jgi:hypothetical protein